MKSLALGALLSIASQRGWAGAPLVIDPYLDEAKYCLERDGGITLRITLGLWYRNVGQTPVVLSLVTLPLSYALFQDEASIQSKRPEVRKKFRRLVLFDAMGLDKGSPPEDFFDAIEPGAIFDRRAVEVRIPVRPDRGIYSAEITFWL